MSRFLLLGASLLLASASAAGAAETCSSSTLTSSSFAVARWCGDPPTPGTLRMSLRSGGSTDYRDVPLDVFREVVRTPNVARYVAEDIQPRFQAMPGPTASRPAAVPRVAQAAAAQARVAPARLAQAPVAQAPVTPSRHSTTASRVAEPRLVMPVLAPTPLPGARAGEVLRRNAAMPAHGAAPAACARSGAARPPSCRG